MDTRQFTVIAPMTQTIAIATHSWLSTPPLLCAYRECTMKLMKPLWTYAIYFVSKLWWLRTIKQHYVIISQFAFLTSLCGKSLLFFFIDFFLNYSKDKNYLKYIFFLLSIFFKFYFSFKIALHLFYYFSKLNNLIH